MTLNIEQSTSATEYLNDSKVVNKIYDLITNNQLDALSNIVGTINVPSSYEETINAVLLEFPDFHITATKKYIKFADPLVESVLISHGASQDSIGITKDEAETFTAFTSESNGTWFENRNSNPNAIITSFNELLYFKNITTLWGYAAYTRGSFRGCSNLTSIDIRNITNLNSGVFLDCTNLESVGLLNSAVTTIQDRTFYNCPKLESIDLSHITRIESKAFYGCSVLGNINTDLSGLTYIGNEAFRGCLNLGVTELNLPNISGTLDLGTFMSVKNITKIISLGSITLINSAVNSTGGAFAFCSNLTEVTLPATLTKIGGGVFKDCPLTKITCLATTPPTVYNTDGYWTLFNVTSGMKIYVPAASVADYQAASGWSTYASYIEAISTT